MKWSSAEVADSIKTIEGIITDLKAATELEDTCHRRVLHYTSAAWNESLNLDAERSLSQSERVWEANELFMKARYQKQEMELNLQRAVQTACYLLETADFRQLLQHPSAHQIICCMPVYPIGALYQGWVHLSLESVAFHARTYWDPMGCRYFFDNETIEDEVAVRVIGPLRAILSWMYQEYQENEDVRDSFTELQSHDPKVAQWIAQEKIRRSAEDDERAINEY